MIQSPKTVKRMIEIKPGELYLFKRYLMELRDAPTKPLETLNFRDRWKPHREELKNISARIDEVMSEKDMMAAEGVVFHKSHNMHGDDEIHRKNIEFYLEGIATSRQSLELELLEGDLMEKPIREMTGFELKTLLLATLKESQAEGNQVKIKNAS